jgi:subtilisin family serine protease
MFPSRYAAGLIAALLVAGCAEMQQESASEETLLTASATVAAVDQATRRVTLTDNAGGGTFTVTAGPEVRNLPQLTAGDQVSVDYYQATTLSMADPADSGEPAAGVVAGRTPEGALPGGAVATTESLVVTVESYDPDSGLAIFRTPDNFTRRAVVPPDLRSFAAQQGPGSRVLVTFTEALAVTITEAEA